VGVVPERRAERMMWLLFVPIVAAWCALPWLAVNRDAGALALPPFAREVPFVVLRWLAAAVAVTSFVLTLRAWRRMGRDWRMDISKDNRTLITDGLFARIRHPIYAFSIAMMIATSIVLPTWPMIVVAIVHVTLMNVKARNEESHLARLHGEAYAKYVARTGRFFPRAAERNA
jgi:protein-S-isoprenylcysteine O-methyltransferase Ste14